MTIIKVSEKNLSSAKKQGRGKTRKREKNGSDVEIREERLKKGQMAKGRIERRGKEGELWGENMVLVEKKWGWGKVQKGTGNKGGGRKGMSEEYKERGETRKEEGKE